ALRRRRRSGYTNLLPSETVMRLTFKSIHGFAVVLTVCLLTAGCGLTESRTKDNFSKIRNGMGRAEVEKLLGKPDQEQKSDMFYDATSLKWGGETKYIEIIVGKDNKVKIINQKGVVAE